MDTARIHEVFYSAPVVDSRTFIGLKRTSWYTTYNLSECRAHTIDYDPREIARERGTLLRIAFLSVSLAVTFQWFAAILVHAVHHFLGISVSGPLFWVGEIAILAAALWYASGVSYAWTLEAHRMARARAERKASLSPESDEEPVGELALLSQRDLALMLLRASVPFEDLNQRTRTRTQKEWQLEKRERKRRRRSSRRKP